MLNFTKIYTRLKRSFEDDSRTFARTPRKFAFKDWRIALKEAGAAIKTKRIPVLAAGIAYFLTLAAFPAIAAAVAILGFVVSDTQLKEFVAVLETYVPDDIAHLISTQLEAALGNPSSGIFIIIAGIGLSLLSVSGAITNLINASNAIYEETETRSFIALRLRSLALVVVAGVLLLIVGGLLLLNEKYLIGKGLPDYLALSIIVVRWVIIAIAVAITLAIFYRYAPNRNNPHWQWVTWGSSIATIIWLIGTTLFFIYARYLAHYTEAYSVFAGIIVLMIWFNLTAFAILIGAEINYRLENQTRARTTE